MIHIKGPEIGEANNVLKSALDLHLKGQPWHFTVKGNIVKSPGKPVIKTMSRKSSLPFYK